MDFIKEVIKTITMKTLNIFSIATLIVLFLLTACKKEETPRPEPVPNYNITILDQYTTLPAKVSMFLQIEDKNGNPVSDLVDSDFAIYEKGINDDSEKLISTNVAERQIAPKGGLFSYNTLLILDLSGGDLNDNLQAIKEASKKFIDQIMPSDEGDGANMAIYWFDGEDILHQLAPLTNKRTDLKVAIEGINSQISSDNSTDLYGAVLKSTEAAQMILANNDSLLTSASIVLFTDGTDQAARYTRDAALSAVQAAKDQIAYYAIGLGNEIDRDVLEAIGLKSSTFASSTEQLNQRFEEIAGAVFNQANSFYLFEYCSPKRNGTNDLRVEVKKGTKKGAVTTSFDAIGFKGGCEL